MSNPVAWPQLNSYLFINLSVFPLLKIIVARWRKLFLGTEGREGSVAKII